jgi:hypothetical protein
MASRLALKYGLVSEEDRLSNSSDAVVVTEPSTGSKARTKGSLYLIVCSKTIGGRTRDACQLVADTIRREYYYDESAGIAIVLEKAVRAANKRLRQSREGGGVAAYSIGIALAVVRGNELYVATAGDANAYLIRSARLLMPEHQSGVGLPAADNLRLGVWRGDFAVGDSLVLSSRNLVEVVGTEELKNAVVTLHPQSAVEHLHHLFVAAGGEGSDAVLALEATEFSLSRVEHRLVPVVPAEPLAGTPERSPIPLADHVAGFATAVRERAGSARSGIGDRISGAVNRVLDLMPRRRTGYRRIRTAKETGENRRRATIAAVALVAVIVVLGALVWYLGPFRSETPINNTPDAQAALADAIDKANQVVGPADLLHSDPTKAEQLLQQAWDDLDGAKGAVDVQAWNRVHAQVSAGLDTLFGTTALTGTEFYAAPAGSEITGLVVGPDNAAYAIVGTGVVRIDPTTGSVATIIQTGSGSGQGIAQPRLLSRGGRDLLIVDVRGALWRWRASDAQGSGTLGDVRIAGDQVWGPDVVDVETFVINPDQGLYRLYVPYPPSQQILRYEPTADASGFSAPAPYFVGSTEDVSGFRQLMIDGDVYAVTEPGLLRYFNGRDTGFSLDPPPDDQNLRPGHLYESVDATGTKGNGQLFVWDKQWSRILVYDKVEGSYLEQYVAAAGAPAFADMRGMYIVDRGVTQPPMLVWARPEGLFQVPLTQPQIPTGSPGVSPLPSSLPSGPPSALPSSLPSGRPTIGPSPIATPTPPPATGSPIPPSTVPTERPRRTPRGVTPSATP